MGAQDDQRIAHLACKNLLLSLPALTVLKGVLPNFKLLQHRDIRQRSLESELSETPKGEVWRDEDCRISHGRGLVNGIRLTLNILSF